MLDRNHTPHALIRLAFLVCLGMHSIDPCTSACAADKPVTQIATASSSSNTTDMKSITALSKVTALSKIVPESVSDLQSIQVAIEDVVKKGLPATVGVEVGERLGSGVIVTADGFVLTVGHISGASGQNAYVVLPSGAVLRAKTLGALPSIDAGMIKIIDPGPWPHVAMGRSSTLNPGAWCVTLGYPGGFRKNHTPTVRAGRVISASSGTIWTDCPLIAGDSGGPLFDCQGRVIGIHSSIDDPLIDNYHVPIDAFRNSWSRLTLGEPGSEPARGGPVLGLSGQVAPAGCRVTNVSPGGAAEKAGLKIDDVVTRLAGEKVDSIEAMQVVVGKHKVGDKVTLAVIRDRQAMELTATLLKRE
jgi:serine protease Do